jgi:hypothetical protein
MASQYLSEQMDVSQIDISMARKRATAVVSVVSCLAIGLMAFWLVTGMLHAGRLALLALPVVLGVSAYVGVRLTIRMIKKARYRAQRRAILNAAFVWDDGSFDPASYLS